MKMNDIEQRVKQIEGYSKVLAQSIVIMDERLHILKPLLSDVEIKEALGNKLKNTRGAHAYNHLVPLIAQDLVRDISRLYLDENKKACSLVNIWRKSNAPKIHEKLKKNFASIPESWREGAALNSVSKEVADKILDEMTARDIESYAKDFDETWERIDNTIDELSTDSVAIKLKQFRDKHHSHLEMAPLGKDPEPFDVKELGLTFSEIIEFIDYYMKIALELTRITTGNVRCIKDFKEIHNKRGLELWRILSGTKLNQN